MKCDKSWNESNNLIACDQFEVVQQHIRCSRSVVFYHCRLRMTKIYEQKKIRFPEYKCQFGFGKPIPNHSDIILLFYVFWLWCCGNFFSDAFVLSIVWFLVSKWHKQTKPQINCSQREIPKKVKLGASECEWLKEKTKQNNLFSSHGKYVMFYEKIPGIWNCKRTATDGYYQIQFDIFLTFFCSLLCHCSDKNDIDSDVLEKMPSVTWHSSICEINNNYGIDVFLWILKLVPVNLNSELIMSWNWNLYSLTENISLFHATGNTITSDQDKLHHLLPNFTSSNIWMNYLFFILRIFEIKTKLLDRLREGKFHQTAV